MLSARASSTASTRRPLSAALASPAASRPRVGYMSWASWVKQDANATEIKKAYYKLSLKQLIDSLPAYPVSVLAPALLIQLRRCDPFLVLCIHSTCCLQKYAYTTVVFTFLMLFIVTIGHICIHGTCCFRKCMFIISTTIVYQFWIWIYHLRLSFPAKARWGILHYQISFLNSYTCCSTTTITFVYITSWVLMHNK